MEDKDIPQQGGFTNLPGAEQYHYLAGNHSAFYLRLNYTLNFHTVIHKI